MTASAEERAKEKHTETFREWSFRRGVWPPIEGTPIEVAFQRLGEAFVEYADHVIAAALRQAENDKLEEAATALTDDIDGSGKDPYEACLLRSAAMIRALKKD